MLPGERQKFPDSMQQPEARRSEPGSMDTERELERNLTNFLSMKRVDEARPLSSLRSHVRQSSKSPSSENPADASKWDKLRLRLCTDQLRVIETARVQMLHFAWTP